MNNRDCGKVISKEQLIEKLTKLKGTRLHVQMIFRKKPSYDDICTYVNQLTIQDVFEIGNYIFIKEGKGKDIRFWCDHVSFYDDEKDQGIYILYEDDNIYHIVELFYNCEKILNS